MRIIFNKANAITTEKLIAYAMLIFLIIQAVVNQGWIRFALLGVTLILIYNLTRPTALWLEITDNGCISIGCKNKTIQIHKDQIKALRITADGDGILYIKQKPLVHFERPKNISALELENKFKELGVEVQHAVYGW